MGKHLDIDIDQIKEYWETTSLSIQEIADRMNTKYDNIRSRIKKYNFIRPDNLKQEADNKRISRMVATNKTKDTAETKISLSKQQIIMNCCICGKEFELSYAQKQSYISQGKREFVCSKECKSKYNKLKFTQARPKVLCCICGKEFELSSNQLTKYNKGQTEFYCSQSCIMKKSLNNIDFVKRKITAQALYNDTDWVAARAYKAKQTSLQKYGVENPSQSDICKEKAKQTKLERYGDANYNNRIKMFQTMKNNNFDIYASRPNVGKKVSQAWKNKSEEEKANIKKKLSQANTKAHNEMTLHKKLEIAIKLSESQKKRWEETSDEEKAEIFKKVFNHPNNSVRVISKLNRDIADILRINELEFQLGRYSYDLKKNNMLIEIDPTYTHNCLVGTWYGGNPKTKEYHRDKTQYAIDNGYKCIHIFDWDNISKISYLLQDKQTLYARKLNIRSVSLDICNEFINKYHLQNSCKGQEVRLGLYLNNELVEIMTFGKPRYNKNYEWELLRLCTKPEYKIVGGAEKLFKHFISKYNPSSIISYCDFSKFSGEVYTRLGFKQKGSITPSKHWSKGNKHITDNLLRQRGYDQLFNANYGKGTSNEELMIENGWLPIYDCGQITFVWREG